MFLLHFNPSLLIEIRLQVMDFECTCEDEVYEYEHEIIEFPAVLIDVRNRRIVSSFGRSHILNVISLFSLLGIYSALQL